MRQRGRCQVARPRAVAEIAAAFAEAAARGLSVGLRGSGCSYGDAALNSGQMVLDLTALNRILAWDRATGEITVEPGVTIEQLWRHTLADGWWPPVVPGTMAVSVGGAAAGNIHGKNQWRHGSFGEQITRFEMALPSGEVVACSREEHPDLFNAAIGGWGLLGCFTSLTLRMRRVSSGLVHVTQTAHPTLEALLAAVEAGTARATHLVGWMDTGARGSALGRGLLKAMREPDPGEDPEPAATLDPARQHYERYVPANFMLNFIPNFKQIYRPGGLIQHQTFAPRAAASALFRAVLERSQRAGLEPSLAVLKKHRPSPFLLNYLPDGYSLALDYAVPRGKEAATLALLGELNALVADAGGSFFLAKDSTLAPDDFRRAFPNEALAEFRALKQRYDPGELLQTDIYRRVIRPALEVEPT